MTTDARAGRSSMSDFSRSVPSGRPARRRRRRRIRKRGSRSSCPATTFESKPRPSTVSAKVPCTSSQARTQREQTMHLAGSKRSRVRTCRSAASRWLAPRSRTHLGRPTRPAMSCSSQSPLAGRSGSRAGGRRCRAPSPRGAASPARRSGCGPHAVAHRRGAGGRSPFAPSISTRHSRQEPKASRCRWRTASGS